MGPFSPGHPVEKVRRPESRGVVGRGRGGTAYPTFVDRGDASPTPPTFWAEIRAKVSPLLQLVTY